MNLFRLEGTGAFGGRLPWCLKLWMPDLWPGACVIEIPYEERDACENKLLMLAWGTCLSPFWEILELTRYCLEIGAFLKPTEERPKPRWCFSAPSPSTYRFEGRCNISMLLYCREFEPTWADFSRGPWTFLLECLWKVEDAKLSNYTPELVARIIPFLNDLDSVFLFSS